MKPIVMMMMNTKIWAGGGDAEMGEPEYKSSWTSGDDHGGGDYHESIISRSWES